MESLDIESLGSAAAVVIVVFMFLKSLRARDEISIAQSKARDERMVRCFDQNSTALENNSKVTGAMLEALRRMNGKD